MTPSEFYVEFTTTDPSVSTHGQSTGSNVPLSVRVTPDPNVAVLLTTPGLVAVPEANVNRTVTVRLRHEHPDAPGV